jgi:hypothetical protein
MNVSVGLKCYTHESDTDKYSISMSELGLGAVSLLVNHSPVL